MEALPEDDIEEARAALAPTLDATASILPLLARRHQERFPKKLNEDWIVACRRLATAWSDRHGEGNGDVRPAIFALYALALETGDADCLRLGEALAGAADRLEDGEPPVQLIAALTACIEALADPGGLEHEAFIDRAQHFAQRLEGALQPGSERSVVLDRLFITEAQEQIEIMHEALDALPPDAVALQDEAQKLALHAEQLALWGVMHLARQLAADISAHATELDEAEHHDRLRNRLDELAASVAAVDR